MVELAVLQVAHQVDQEPRLHHGGFFGTGVEGDLGTQVGRMHHAHVLLRAADVARVFEREPGWPVSNNIDSILRHRSTAGTRLYSAISPRAACASRSV